ncbi:hypothetical protein BUALT_Bualt03G0210200 [Buddleja alternifolia]|uniref:Uncharacterized protein n=1 Tax=Buddleja alternifolia TaxID=168488 RepID=A0AAV6Y6F2_9LAMI|nr:hypothetical protein BUALT_Bualt03G0210200 [Buddleja alternifolia]
MSETQEVQFSLKAMINKEKTKVLFAEADRDLGDVLLSFLTLPLGTIVGILEKHYGYESAPVIGSLTSLRRSLANLNDVHFWTKECKLMLLNPISSLEDECRKLKLNIDHDAQPIKYFACETWLHECFRSSGVRIYYDTVRCKCGKSMNRQIGVRKSNTQTVDDGVFTKETVSFAISDDLQIAPNVTGSIVQILCNFGITNIHGAEQITVTLGLNEIVGLLKGALLSKTPLTDLILNKRQTRHLKYESSPVMHKMEEESKSKKMVIKAIVQKSSKKLLFATAKEDFIDFLFSLLTIPLGGVASLVGSNTCFGSINNLCRSIENLNGEEYLKTKDTKSTLLKPELPPMYLSKNQILPLVEQKTPLSYLNPYAPYDGIIRSNKAYRDDFLMCFNDPKGEGSYVKGPGMFMVADDLTVTPLSMLSSVSVFNVLKIPLPDVEEIEFEIGLEEALNIIRASLTSTCALTNGLMIKSVLMKKPKEEQ